MLKKSNKNGWYLKLLPVVLAVVIFYVAFRLGANFGQEKVKPSTPVETSKKQIVDNTPPISISTKDIKEENFTGTQPVISGSSALAVKARAYVAQVISDFRKEANLSVPDAVKQYGADSPFAKYTIDIGAKYVQGEKTESIIIDLYTYTGGAHGLSAYKVFTFSRSEGKSLLLSSVVKTNQQTAFTEFVKKELNNWRPEGATEPVVWEDNVKSLTFKDFTDWSLDDKNLTIYFQDYALGDGALGAVAFPLPLAKIKNFLQAGY